MHDEFLKFVKKAMAVFEVTKGHEKADIEGINYFDVMNVPSLPGDSQFGDDKVGVMKKNIKDEMSAFCTETSFTALTQIYRANSLWKRLLWTALVIAMIVYMGMQCAWLLERYYSYPVEVKLDIKASKVMNFPSVTICNLNPIRLRSVNEDPFKPLQKFASPNLYDMLYEATVDNWNNAGQCENGQIECHGGRCVHESSRCNGKPECPDADDEADCEDHKCPVYQWKCTSLPKCIFLNQRCDGKAGDCKESSDEDENNCHNHTCPEYFIQCSSGNCVPVRSDCDGAIHCQDGDVNCTDESHNSSLSTTSYKISRSPTPQRETSTSSPSSTAATTTKSRIKRQAILRFLMEDVDDDNTHSKDKQDLFDELADFLVKSKNDKKGNDVKFLDAIWQLVKDSLKKEFHDYLASQEFEILKREQLNYNKNKKPEEEVHRSKRQSPTSVDFPTSKSDLSVNMEAMVRNSTFNKWAVLSKLAPHSRFYEERDDEYDAAMTYAYITAKLDKSVVEMSGHAKENFIASCNFAGYQCSPENFTYFYNPKYGNCYIFNWLPMNSTKLETRFPGPEHGLRLELFLDQRNYVANLATEAGVRVLIHKKGSMPFPEDEGVSIMPGRSTSIGMKQVSYTRLPPPHGLCGYEAQTTDYYSDCFNTDYSKLSCLKSCYQDISIKFCNCAVPFYFITAEMDVCNMTDKNIENCVTGLANNYSTSFDTCDKLCPLPCQETKYDLSVSMAQWPSDNYQPFLLSRLGNTNSMYCTVNNSEREFTKLQIYFQDLIYEHVEQQKAYESMNLISDLGGQLGLWLGLSAITIGEICSFLFGVGQTLPWKFWRKKTAPSRTNDVTPNRPITPISLQTMIEDMHPQPARYIPPDNVTDI